MMRRLHAHRNSGLTLIEVMISMVVVFVIAVGAISYMYASARNAKEADVRASAARIGLLLIEGWKANGADVTLFNPASEFNKLPLSDFGDAGALGTLPGLANLLQNRSYRIEANGVKYFVKMTYNDGAPRLLNVCVGWNRDYSSTTPGTSPNLRYESVVLSDYAIF